MAIVLQRVILLVAVRCSLVSLRFPSSTPPWGLAQAAHHWRFPIIDALQAVRKLARFSPQPSHIFAPISTVSPPYFFVRSVHHCFLPESFRP